MFLGDDVAGFRLETGADLPAPVPYFKDLRAQPALWIGAMYFQVS
jgi:hypothetical protein